MAIPRITFLFLVTILNFSFHYGETVSFALASKPNVLVSSSNEELLQDQGVRGIYWASFAGYPASTINTSYFSHIYYAFVRPSPTTYVLNITDSDVEKLLKFANSSSRWNPPAKTLLAIGGFGGGALSGIFSQMASQENSRATFINSTIKILLNIGITSHQGLPKKAETTTSNDDKSGKIQKANKKLLNAKGKNKVKGKGKDKKVISASPTALSLLRRDSQVGSCQFWVLHRSRAPRVRTSGFRIERKLKQGALYLYVGNGVRAQVEAIGSFDLVLPNGLVICLDNCHYAPTITRGVVSVSRLVDNGFVQCFTDCGISVSKNGVLYFNVVPRNGIYEIDMHDLVPNVNSIYNVSNKRVKHNLDSTYLWHCVLLI
ncbi:retrotransposon protein, putative, ty1-copia subclass [Tanacetum coccineum]